MKFIIYVLLISLSIAVGWGCFSLSTNGNEWSTLIAMIYTIVTPYVLFRIRKGELSRKDIFLLLSFPLLYFVSFCVTRELKLLSIFSILLSPVFGGFLLLLASSLTFYYKKSPLNLVFLLFGAYIYAYGLYPDFKKFSYTKVFSFHQYDESIEDGLIENHLFRDDSIHLYQWDFITPERDTSKLTTSGKYVIFETWNETCPPCLRAFKDLPEFYKSISDKADVYYVYEYHRTIKQDVLDQIFHFDAVPSKEKILIDLNQNMYKQLNIKGYPYFLVFDPKGKLVFMSGGYDASIRKELESGILKAIL